MLAVRGTNPFVNIVSGAHIAYIYQIFHISGLLPCDTFLPFMTHDGNRISFRIHVMIGSP